MSDARILDRGYRRYDGERSGVAGAIRSVMVDSIRRMPALPIPLPRARVSPLPTMPNPFPSLGNSATGPRKAMIAAWLDSARPLVAYVAFATCDGTAAMCWATTRGVRGPSPGR